MEVRLWLFDPEERRRRCKRLLLLLGVQQEETKIEDVRKSETHFGYLAAAILVHEQAQGLD